MILEITRTVAEFRGVLSRYFWNHDARNALGRQHFIPRSVEVMFVESEPLSYGATSPRARELPGAPNRGPRLA